jgi:MFS family permease
LLTFSVIGAATVPALSDKLGRRQPFLLISAMLGMFLTYPLLSTTNFTFAATLAGTSGLLQLPSYILLVALSAEFAGQARAGLANSILMLVSSLGGLIIAILMERVGQWLGWDNASLILIGAYMMGFFIALRLGEPTAQLLNQRIEGHFHKGGQ